jgi:hypothetical protein
VQEDGAVGKAVLFEKIRLDGATVVGQNMQRHRHQEFIRFLNTLERDIPAGKVVLGGRGLNRLPGRHLPI